MKHLFVSREFPPVPGGGIGTYVKTIARLLAKAGETVHVISQRWRGAQDPSLEEIPGRLFVHRVPFTDWASFGGSTPHPQITRSPGQRLFASEFPPQCFSLETALLAERLVEEEGIDIIEAQDYEAPLFYFQLRRALGLGPKNKPPCIVHLHSPTELVAMHNGWSMADPYLSTARRLEVYSMGAADALLCPSRFLAHQSEAYFGLDPGSVEVIPYPLPEISFINREEKVWQDGTVCYLGRLEYRKGAEEWIRAAVEVAEELPEVRFDFVGGNTMHTQRRCGDEVADRLIPRGVRKRFRFFGNQPYDRVPVFLSRARVAAVPSRWDNFPNTCMEMMASGLPVIATRQGGMAEMVREGRSGWLTQDADVAALAGILRQALASAGEVLAAMGEDASQDIRRLCDPQAILGRQLKFREEVARRGCDRSLSIPPARTLQATFGGGEVIDDPPSFHLSSTVKLRRGVRLLRRNPAGTTIHVAKTLASIAARRLGLPSH